MFEKYEIKIIMNIFIIIISYKFMKILEIIKINISNINSWYNIELIIYYFVKFNLKNIYIDLNLKYISKKIIKSMKIINNNEKLNLYKYKSNKISK